MPYFAQIKLPPLISFDQNFDLSSDRYQTHTILELHLIFMCIKNRQLSYLFMLRNLFIFIFIDNKHLINAMKMK